MALSLLPRHTLPHKLSDEVGSHGRLYLCHMLFDFSLTVGLAAGCKGQSRKRDQSQFHARLPSLRSLCCHRVKSNKAHPELRVGD